MTSPFDIERRLMKRVGFCRGCDKTLMKGEDVISTYSFRNRGQNIYFCLECSAKIGDLS